MRIENFGKLSDDRRAGLYILENGNGMKAALTDYGAALVSLIVPDAEGRRYDVVLGYDDVSGYEAGTESFGGTVGRYANRIGNAGFDLNGKHYELTANQGPHTLHGGTDFYVHRLWNAVLPFGEVSSRDIAAAYAVESMNDWSNVLRASVSGPQASGQTGDRAGGDSITFTLDSPDGDQGFPGAIHIEVTYTLTPENELHLDYSAWMTDDNSARMTAGNSYNHRDEHSPKQHDEYSHKCHDEHSPKQLGESSREIDQESNQELWPDTTGAESSTSRLATPINLTNHSYFNLNGHDSGSVLGQIAWIDSDRITETDDLSLPTGTFIDVAGTPMDFRRPKPLGRDIGADFAPLHTGNGYDHNYVLNCTQDPTEKENCSDEQRYSTEYEKKQTGYRKVAELYSGDNGLRMALLTDLPGLQLYTANYVNGTLGKDGAVYMPRCAVCFETQFWPDSINNEHFPGSVLHEGEEFHSRTTYAFSN